MRKWIKNLSEEILKKDLDAYLKDLRSLRGCKEGEPLDEEGWDCYFWYRERAEKENEHFMFTVDKWADKIMTHLSISDDTEEEQNVIVNAALTIEQIPHSLNNGSFDYYLTKDDDGKMSVIFSPINEIPKKYRQKNMYK